MFEGVGDGAFGFAVRGWFWHFFFFVFRSGGKEGKEGGWFSDRLGSRDVRSSQNFFAGHDQMKRERPVKLCIAFCICSWVSSYKTSGFFLFSGFERECVWED